MASGNIMMIPVADDQGDSDTNMDSSGINITEQINSSGVWTSLVGNTTSGKKQKKSERYATTICIISNRNDAF